MDVGIDLGTATVIVYIGGEGVVLSEPSVIAVNLKTDSVISVGQEAYEMIGKTPSHIQAIRPLSKGVVCNYKMTEEMVKHFIKKICKDSLIKPRIAMCVPSGITNVESNAVIDVAIASGARKVYLIEEPVAAAIGAQIDIEKPNGNLIVDIGGGTTDIAVLSLNGIVNKKSIKIAGDTINDAIVRYVRNSHGVLIGEKMADQIKRQVASVCWEEGEDISAPVKGRNLTTGLPCNIEISRSMLYDCVIKEVEQIITAVKEVIERTPPELVGDIHTNGITLTGGGSLLHGIAPLLEKHTRIHTVIAEDPVNSARENPSSIWTNWWTDLSSRRCRGCSYAGFSLYDGAVGSRPFCVHHPRPPLWHRCLFAVRFCSGAPQGPCLRPGHRLRHHPAAVVPRPAAGTEDGIWGGHSAAGC